MWRDWSKVHQAGMFWMDVVTSDEMNALGELLGLDTEIIRDSYISWGPSARNCVRFAKDPEERSRHEADVILTATSLTKNPNDFSFEVPSATHWIFLVRPSPNSRRLVTVDYATNRLREIVVRAYCQQDKTARYRFYRTIRRHPWFGAPAGHMYEIHVLLWFAYAQATQTLSCTGAQADSPELEIPSCPGNVIFFDNVDELSHLMEISKPEGPMCLVPTSRTFPTLDAVVLTNDTIITVKITISPKHDAMEEGFGLIYKNLPPDLLFERPHRCHVFITDDGLNAKSLREQNRTEIPDGILSYTTVIDVNDLDSQAPATIEHLDALEEARVSSTGRMRFDMDLEI
jgi:hypothetical protein